MPEQLQRAPYNPRISRKPLPPDLAARPEFAGSRSLQLEFRLTVGVADLELREPFWFYHEVEQTSTLTLRESEMIKVLPQSEGNVLVVEATGKLSDQDYNDVMRRV